MALTKQTTTLADGVTERGQINVKTIIRVIEDGGNELSVSIQRKVLNPGDPLDGEAAQVAAVANAVWTPEIIAAWQADQPAPDPVPQEVTRRQAVQALILTGKVGLVQPAIDAIADPTQRALMQSEWSDSQTFQRQRPSLIQMATAIGLSSADLDNLFTFAATL